jgi:hypothetical protein
MPTTQPAQHHDWTLDWTLPNPDALLDPEGPPVPDDESLLSELGATYPVVAYPASQDEAGEDQLEETIYAGFVFP